MVEVLASDGQKGVNFLASRAATLLDDANVEALSAASYTPSLCWKMYCMSAAAVTNFGMMVSSLPKERILASSM
eukprot:3686183-Pyramimonas_sp.AAC.1